MPSGQVSEGSSPLSSEASHAYRGALARLSPVTLLLNFDVTINACRCWSNPPMPHGGVDQLATAQVDQLQTGANTVGPPGVH